MLHEKWGIFPDGGCYNDQPAALLQDWETLDRRYADIYEHCVGLEKEDIWLPATLKETIPDEPTGIQSAEPVPPTNDLIGRLRGA